MIYLGKVLHAKHLAGPPADEASDKKEKTTAESKKPRKPAKEDEGEQVAENGDGSAENSDAEIDADGAGDGDDAEVDAAEDEEEADDEEGAEKGKGSRRTRSSIEWLFQQMAYYVRQEIAFDAEVRSLASFLL